MDENHDDVFVKIFISRVVNTKINWKVVHSKLGHLNKRSLIDMAKHQTLLGLTYETIDWTDTQACEICARANIRQFRVPRKVDRRPGGPFKRGSVDIYGPVSVPSVGGNRYGMIYCDDENSFGMIDFVKDKSLQTVTSTILKWKLVADDMGYRLQQLQFDSDPIFENEELEEILVKERISARFAPPGRHQSNGLVERMIQTVVGMARSMLIGSGLPLKYWTYAMSYAMLIYNATLKSRFKDDEELKYKSPYLMMTGDMPVYDFPIFGCYCISRNPNALQGPAFDPRGRRGVFLGFDSQHHDVYSVLNLETNEIVISEEVVLLEDYYGYTRQPTDYYSLDKYIKEARETEKIDERSIIVPDEVQQTSEAREEPLAEESGQYWFEEDQPVFRDQRPDIVADVEQPTMREALGKSRVERYQEQLREPTRIQPSRKSKKISLTFENWKGVLNEMEEEVKKEYNQHQTEVLRIMNCYDEGYDISEVLSYVHNVSSRIVEGEQEKVPQSFREATSALYIDKYREAIISEVKSQLENDTFYHEVYEDIPEGHTPVDTKWVFDIKNVTTGGVKRYKARMVIRGFMQRYQESYFDTYSPTCTKDSIRLILSLAAMYRLRTIHIDIKTAFLYGELEPHEILYVPIPDGFLFDNLFMNYFPIAEAEKLKRVVKNKKGYLQMKKSCYGTKQAARNWYKKLDEVIAKLGFTFVPGDPCLYIKRRGFEFLIIGIYVDDIFGVGTSNDMFEDLSNGLHEHFQMSDMGEIQQCLGMRVTRNVNTGDIILNNDIYMSNILKEFQMENCKVCETPAVTNYYLTVEDCPDIVDPELQNKYRSLIGSLMYAAICWRPDIIYRVCHLARFCHAPGVKHFDAGLRVLKYVRATVDYGLLFKGGQNHIDVSRIRPRMVTCSDASYAGDDDAISVSGGVNFMIDEEEWMKSIQELKSIPPKYNITGYVSKRQKVVACSSTEAEYIAGYDNAKIIIHKSQILECLGFIANKPHVMYVDNQSMMSIVDEWKVGDRTKHMNVRYHYLREKVIHEEIVLWKVHTDFNTADFFTKPLDRITYEFHRESCMSGKVDGSRSVIPIPVKVTSRDEVASIELMWLKDTIYSTKDLNSLEKKRKGNTDGKGSSQPWKYIRK
jgi:hypothetical protein